MREEMREEMHPMDPMERRGESRTECEWRSCIASLPSHHSFLHVCLQSTRGERRLQSRSLPALLPSLPLSLLMRGCCDVSQDAI